MISLWILGTLTGIFLLGMILFVLFLTVTNYHPDPVEYIEVKGTTGHSIINYDEFTLMTWNIGYAGLGKDMDFFYEGGKRVKPGQDEFRKYLDGILQTVRSNDTLDFLLIQEADTDSKRSYHVDESEELAKVIKDHCVAFAKSRSGRTALPKAHPR